MLRPTFFSGKDSFLCDVCTRVVFFPEALRDLEAWFVIVAMGTWLLFALSIHSESFELGIVMPVGSDVCVEDV